jgi:hypothetical protein
MPQAAAAYDQLVEEDRAISLPVGADLEDPAD